MFRDIRVIKVLSNY